jgi:hypothetical protein
MTKKPAGLPENSDESEPPIPVKVSHLQMVVG